MTGDDRTGQDIRRGEDIQERRGEGMTGKARGKKGETNGLI